MRINRKRVLKIVSPLLYQKRILLSKYEYLYENAQWCKCENISSKKKNTTKNRNLHLNIQKFTEINENCH